MIQGNIRFYPIRLAVPYWEFSQVALSQKLDALVRKHVTDISSFLPWQAVESDCSQTLARFVHAVSERGLRCSFIVTPECAMPYPAAGIPKDVLQLKDVEAQDATGLPYRTFSTPVAFALPSLHAPLFLKRYESFLGRLDHFLFDLFQMAPHLREDLTFLVTGSFWPYYKHKSIQERSKYGQLARRQCLEELFSRSEFSDPTPQAALKWRTPADESSNEWWFTQWSERQFRSRTRSMLTKRSSARVQMIDWLVPEMDSSVFHATFLAERVASQTGFKTLNKALRAPSKAQSVDGLPLTPWLYWYGLGLFRQRSEQEKQYLVLSSLLRTGGLGGGIYMDEEEWFALSPTFRHRVEVLARALEAKDWVLKPRVATLRNHVSENNGSVWDDFAKGYGPLGVSLTQVEALESLEDVELLWVEPEVLLDQKTFRYLVDWASVGRTVVLFERGRLTESARFEQSLMARNHSKIDLNLGIPYQLYALKEGRMCWVSAQGSSLVGAVDRDHWYQLMEALEGFSTLLRPCQADLAQIECIPLTGPKGQMAVFVLNPTKKRLLTHLRFPTPVKVTDFRALEGKSEHMDSAEELVTELRLEVPAYGVLPLVVWSQGFEQARSKRMAMDVSNLAAQSAWDSAATELPGFDPSQALQEFWNP
jgi:hypothetical protein